MVSGVRSLNGSSVWCFSYPFVPHSTSAFSLPLLSFKARNPKDSSFNDPPIFCTPPRHTNFAGKISSWRSCWLFCFIFIKNIKARRALSDNNVAAGCWSRGEHLLRDRFKSARARAPTRIKPLRSIRLRRINRKSNNSPLVADVDSIMFARAACF